MSSPSSPPALIVSRIASSVSGTVSDYEPVFRPIEAIAFWAAVAMPFVYLPLLITGIETTSEGIAMVALIALHALALIVGRRYRAER
jgi:hypothetical protein